MESTLNLYNSKMLRSAQAGSNDIFLLMFNIKLQVAKIVWQEQAFEIKKAKKALWLTFEPASRVATSILDDW